MEEYFLLCSYILSTGSKVEPGNWGRMLKLYKPSMNVVNPYREQIYEKIRQQNFPNRPSRLECIFLCETEEEAKLFKERTGRIFDLIYKVRIVDTEKPIFRADWDKVKFADPDDTGALEKRAYEYWEGLNITRPEILTLSSVEIVELL
jgi:hypothetical protein